MEQELKELRAKNKGSKAKKTNFLMEYEYLSAQTPGPGHYHPRVNITINSPYLLETIQHEINGNV